jgi:hypothetical protein
MSHVVGERLRNHQGLVVVCTAAAAVEALLVGAFAPTSSLGLATQVTAPPPFGVFHDLRWIVVYHESWIGLACELLAFVVFRSLLTALCLRAARPYDIPPEPWALTIRRSVLFTVIVGVLLAPWAALMFALAVVSLSWLFFVAIPVVLMLALLVHGGAVTGSWWSRTLSAQPRLGPRRVRRHSLFGSIMTTCPVWRAFRRRARGSRTPGSGCTWSTRCCILDGLLVHSRWRPSASPVCWRSSSADRRRLRPCEDAGPAFRLPGRSGDAVEPGGDADERNAARRRTGFNTQVGRPCRAVRARRSSAVALLVSRHRRRAAAVYGRRHTPLPSRPRALTPPSVSCITRHRPSPHDRRRE